MAPTPSIRVVKSFSYRDTTQLWSNRYHFNGGVPGSDSAWHTFMDAVVNAEKLCLTGAQTIVECLGYEAGSDLAVASKTYSTVGTATGTGGQNCPGDVAAVVRYATAVRTSKNHPIYLFNYYHGAFRDSSTTDTLLPAQKTLFETYASAWLSGFSDGTHTLNRAGPNGANAVDRKVLPYLSHRDFPR